MSKSKKAGGKLTSTRRNKLPNSAFALPSERKYPLHVMSDGKAVPSRSHASNAKARATQMYRAGKLSASQKATIDRKANAILNKGKK